MIENVAKKYKIKLKRNENERCIKAKIF